MHCSLTQSRAHPAVGGGDQVGGGGSTQGTERVTAIFSQLCRCCCGAKSHNRFADNHVVMHVLHKGKER